MGTVVNINSNRKNLILLSAIGELLEIRFVHLHGYGLEERIARHGGLLRQYGVQPDSSLDELITIMEEKPGAQDGIYNVLRAQVQGISAPITPVVRGDMPNQYMITSFTTNAASLTAAWFNKQGEGLMLAAFAPVDFRNAPHFRLANPRMNVANQLARTRAISRIRDEVVEILREVYPDYFVRGVRPAYDAQRNERRLKVISAPG